MTRCAIVLVVMVAFSPVAQAQEVGRLLLLSFTGTEAPLEQLKTFRPAGFVLFPSNVSSVSQTRALTRQLRAAAPYPLLLGIDQEGGTVSSYRLGGVALFPGNLALGAAGDSALARRVGEAIGQDLAYAGLNLDFAPVVDVASEPDNPIVGVRAFGSRPAAVAALGTAFTAGLEAAGIAAVAKHFPGHGGTLTDSHRELPVLRRSREGLERLELYPFRALIGAGVPAVMSAHVVFPALDDAPATLSRPILTDLLRDELGFDGVVITDAMNMRALTGRYGPGEAAVRSIRAGADLLLLVASRDVQDEVYRALEAALQDGRLSRTRVRQAILRSSALAQRYQLKTAQKPDLERHARLAERVAGRAATLLWNDPIEGKRVLPLRPSQQVLVVAPQPGGYGAAQHLGSFLKAVRGGVRSVRVSDDPTAAERQEAVSKARSADVVVLASHHGFGAFPPSLRALEADLARAPAPLVVVALGRPDDLRFFAARPAAYAAVYGYRDANLAAAAALLLGQRPPTGRLPVPAGRFPVGAGLKGYR